MPPRPFLIAAIVALLAAMLPAPYGYYQLLRLAVCALGLWGAVGNWREGRTVTAGVWGLLALLYNPVFRVHFDRETWTLINLATAGFLGVCLWRGRRSPV